ncbi:MAG: hypothetical protein PVJ85_14850, partial [Anaerolineae bacterium]
MIRFVHIISLITLMLVLAAPGAMVAAAPPGVTIKLLNPPPGGTLELARGESYTFEIEVKSREPFQWAMAMTDAYYPGRGIDWRGMDRASKTSGAVLRLTMTGKNSTAHLAAVCDWPEPGDCWPAGTAP